MTERASVDLAEAIDNAARLLRQAEADTDRQLAELWCRMAEGWTAVAAIVAEQIA